MIEAKVIKHSQSAVTKHSLITMELIFPRFILAEFNTHRMFSRNSASSRAIPFEKMVAQIEENPFIPIAFQKEHKGMQGTEYFESTEEIESLNYLWRRARNEAVSFACKLNKLKVTKQLCNRLLEPFMWHKVLVTSTEAGLENFFELRCPQYNPGCGAFRSRIHAIETERNALEGGEFQETTRLCPDKEDTLEWLKLNKGAAEIHMTLLAEAMLDEYASSVPRILEPGEWHVPFVDTVNPTDEELKVSVAQSARVSYLTVGGEKNIQSVERDCILHDSLLKNKHMSPFEHIGRVMTQDDYINHSGKKPSNTTFEHGWSRNFRGFKQYREIIEENG